MTRTQEVDLTLCLKLILPRGFLTFRHWDIEFIFKGKIPDHRIPQSFASSELALVNLDTAKEMKSQDRMKIF